MDLNPEERKTITEFVQQAPQEANALAARYEDGQIVELYAQDEGGRKLDVDECWDLAVDTADILLRSMGAGGDGTLWFDLLSGEIDVEDVQVLKYNDRIQVPTRKAREKRNIFNEVDE